MCIVPLTRRTNVFVRLSQSIQTLTDATTATPVPPEDYDDIETDDRIEDNINYVKPSKVKSLKTDFERGDIRQRKSRKDILLANDVDIFQLVDET